MKRKYKVISILLCFAFILCSCSDSTVSSVLTDTTSAEADNSSQPDLPTDNKSFDIRAKITETINSTMNALEQDSSLTIDEQTVGEDIVRLYEFTNRTGCYPVYKCSEIEYYPMGEQALESMLDELEKAERFIFIEYFIINEGKLWDKVYDILKRKASQGVDVRIIYDGLMDGTALPDDFPSRLEADGIKCHIFSSLLGNSLINTNTRDHRKIMDIDGKVVFTGGMNLADEYINLTHPYGVWKDNAMKIKGNAVNSFTLMFLQIWCAYEDETDVEDYLSELSLDEENDGYIMPFSENPFDEYSVAKSFYISVLDNAKDYVYIITPYLLPDTELETAIISAAERGIDVRIYVPSVSDKQSVNLLTKSHYRPLISAGVRIFEYNKGFIHSKVFLSDDIKSIVGTINLDNRSLVYHFECGAYIYKSSVINEIKKEFTDNESDFMEISEADINAYGEAGGYLLKGIEGFL